MSGPYQACKHCGYETTYPDFCQSCWETREEMTPTDLDKLSSLLTQFEVVYEEQEYKGKIHVTVETGAGPRNTGYMDFVTVFEFDQAGTFLKMGAWE